MNKKFIRICADDYGLTKGIDQGIIHLLHQKAINCTSCMTESPRWLNDSASLLKDNFPENSSIELGLHLNLTEAFCSTVKNKYTLKKVLALSYLRQWNKINLEQQLQKQFDLFEQGLKQIPDFIDGHQHIHQFPVIRDLILEIVAKRYANEKPWIRNTLPAKLNFNFKALSLVALGGLNFKKQLQYQTISTNHGFLGVYNFTGDYELQMKKWLQQAKSHSLIMCHPSAIVDPLDGIGVQRVKEYEFLMSEAFQILLQQYHLTLST